MAAFQGNTSVGAFVGYDAYSQNEAAAASILGSASSMVGTFDISPQHVYYPFYHASRQELLTWITDRDLALLIPVVFYWVYSMFWHYLDVANLSFLDKYRIHEPEEMTKKNRVSASTVIKMVAVQHIIQTIIGLWFMENDSEFQYRRDHKAEMQTYAYYITRVATTLLGPSIGSRVLRAAGPDFVQFMYWWGVPIIQFFWASFLLDTWQYFLHRAFHVNKFLYRTIHSIHHRLYCPYAFGALYNHPLEGILFDTVGTGVAHQLSLLTTRQAMLLFGITTLKTVDDHCGFAIPLDPFQLLFGNNSAYHDIHHQQFGIKRNFSQPYFTHWDVLLNTRMTPEQVPERIRQKYNAGPAALPKRPSVVIIDQEFDETSSELSAPVTPPAIDSLKKEL